MIVSEWEKNRAQLVADAIRDLITRGVQGADPQAPLLTAEQIPAAADAQGRLTAYGILAALNTHEPWINVGTPEVPFLNGTYNYAAGNRPVQFRKEYGRVFIRGLVADVTVGLPIFVLPEGYRPSIYENLAALAEGGDANLVIQPDGTVYINLTPSGTSYCSFAGVTFFPD